MSDIFIQYDPLTRGRNKYYADIQHDGLNQYKRVYGSDEYEVQSKAAAQLAQWDAKYNSQLTKEAAVQDKESKKSYAAQQTAAYQAEIEALRSLIADTLQRDDRLDWETLKDRSEFSKPKPVIAPPQKPTPPELPSPPMQSEPRYTPRFCLLDLLIPSRKQQKEAEADSLFKRDISAWRRTKEQIELQAIGDNKNYKVDMKKWQADVEQAEKRWECERREFEIARRERNASIDAMRESYMRLEPGSIVEYCKLILERSEYPHRLDGRSFEVDYVNDSGIVVVEYVLPAPDAMPNIKEVKYVQSRDAIEETQLSPSIISSLYDEVIYQIALRTLHELFEADVVNAITAVVFNGWVNHIDKSTGQQVNACLISLQASREEFLSIDLANVDPKACFRKLKGVGSAKLHALSPVAPILQMNKEDKRFVSSYEVAEKLNEGTNLAAMDWEDFEHLIRELFETEFAQHGGEVKVTQASRDGGVDAVAFDPDPIRGGKIVIQAKRYTNTVGVSAVRDLYGTVVNEGATKGILVTTADYGPDAYEFAKGKPLTLLNGGNLLHLLEKHGHKAHIDLREAKQILGSQPSR